MRRQTLGSTFGIEPRSDAVRVVQPKNAKSQSLAGIVLGDARSLVRQLETNSVDVTITSPPYFDLKDYGSKEQLGFGQKYGDYLRDLSDLFHEVFRATNPHGSLWVVIDTFRKSHEVCLLPFDLAGALKSRGWILRDIIIWKKDRTLPWAHKGVTRRIFEYILVFSKSSESYQYFPDEEREFQDLKRWWVQYPERYSPRGKALEEIWNFDIPTQGSWGDVAVSHACPFPSQLVSRIIRLTTKPGQMVFDPFAGSGTVPVQAKLLGRKFLGLDTNSKYVAAARKRLSLISSARSNEAIRPVGAKDFASLIVNLRILKLAKLLLREARNIDPKYAATHVVVSKGSGKPSANYKIAKAEYWLVVPARASKRKLCTQLNERMKKPPHSKFGVQTVLEAVSKAGAIKRTGNAIFNQYSATAPYKTQGRGSLRKVLGATYPILSKIWVNEQVPDD